MRRHYRRHALSVLVCLALLWACDRGHPEERTLNIYAASSLTEALRECGDAFEKLHPEARTALSFAGSQTLRLQIEQGARADIFASASPQHMTALVESRKAETPTVFAHNELVVIVPRNNPAGIQSFRDLTRAKRIVLGQPGVPIGSYTDALLKRAGKQLGGDFERTVRAQVVSMEGNVRLVRAKVELGEADAAIVYRTDASSSGRVRTIAIDKELNVRAAYPMAMLRGSNKRGLARTWLGFVASDEGKAILRKHGFLVGK